MSDWSQQAFKQTLASRQRLLPQIQPVAAAQAEAKNSGRDTAHIHPSALASSSFCERATYYQLTDVPQSDPDRPNFQKLNIFAEGDTIHEKYQAWLYGAGILVGMWKCLLCEHRWWDKSPAACPECGRSLIKYAEVPLADPAHWLIGHADGLLEDDLGEALLEIKSIGLGTIRHDAPNLHDAYTRGDISLDDLWDRIKRPLAPHLRQISLYMYITGVHDAIVLYEWKPQQHVKEFSVTLEMAVVQPMLDKCLSVMQSVADEELPPRPAAATSKSCSMCQYCPWKSQCWNKK